MDITKMSITELKAFAFDLQNNLQAVANELRKRELEEAQKLSSSEQQPKKS